MNKISIPTGTIPSDLYFFGISVSDKNLHYLKSKTIPTIGDSKYSKIMKEVKRKLNKKIYFSNIYKQIFKDNSYPKDTKQFFINKKFEKDRFILINELKKISEIHKKK